MVVRDTTNIVKNVVEVPTTYRFRDLNVLKRLTSIILGTDVDHIDVRESDGLVVYTPMVRGERIYRSGSVIEQYISRLNVELIWDKEYVTDDRLVEYVKTSVTLYRHPEGVYLIRPEHKTDEANRLVDTIEFYRTAGYFSLYTYINVDKAMLMVELLEAYSIKEDNGIIYHPLIDNYWIENSLDRIRENKLPVYRFSALKDRVDSAYLALKSRRRTKVEMEMLMRTNSGNGLDSVVWFVDAEDIKVYPYVVVMPLTSLEQIKDVDITEKTLYKMELDDLGRALALSLPDSQVMVMDGKVYMIREEPFPDVDLSSVKETINITVPSNVYNWSTFYRLVTGKISVVSGGKAGSTVGEK